VALSQQTIREVLMKLARLKDWRESRGLTQKELAEEAHASEWTVTRAEADEEVRPNTARRLAEVLDVTVADLLERPPVPLAEAPSQAGLPETLEELLVQQGARTRHLLNENLADELLELPYEECLRVARETRSELDAVVPVLDEALERSLKGSQEYGRAARLRTSTVEQSIGVTMALAERAGRTFEKQPLAAPLKELGKEIAEITSHAA